MPASLSLRLACRPDSLRELRRAIDTLEHLPRPVLDAVKIAAHELVSNSIQHSGMREDEQLAVNIQAEQAHIRVEVGDGGRGFRPPSGARGGGWGLPMVQSLSSRMGILHNGTTHAWAEIPLASRP